MPTPWDGKERRVTDERFEAAMDDVHELQGNVSGLRTDMRLFNRVVGLTTVIVLLLVVTTIAQLNDLHRRSISNRAANKTAQQVTIDAVNCILLNLHQHREANEFAHKLITNGLHEDYNEPLEFVPRDITAAVQGSCDALDKELGVLTTTTTTTR